MATVESIERFQQQRRNAIAAQEHEERRNSENRDHDEEQGSTERLAGLLRETITRAHNAVRLRLGRQEADERLELLKTLNPAFLNVSAIRGIEYAGWLALIPAAYVLDCLLFAPNGRHLAQRSFPGQPGMIFAMSFMIPAVVLAVENGISNYLTDWRDSQQKRLMHTAGVWSAAVVATIIVPALVAVTQWALAPAGASNRLTAMFTFQSLALIATALLTHGLVVFGGRRAREAKAFALYKSSESRLRRQSRRLNNDYESNRRAMAEAFTDYRRELDLHNARYPTRLITPGPFDQITAEELNNWFGYQVVILEGQNTNDPPGGAGGDDDSPPAPPAAAGSPPPTPQPPTPAPAEATDGEGVEDYYRSLLSQRISEEESEVRVTNS
jgi:hypothetical protein